MLTAYRYDLETLAPVPSSPAQGVQVALDAPLAKLPVLIRPGTVVPRKMRLRRSSKLMHFDPFTLVVAPDHKGAAKGTLYLDDEFSLAHETEGAFAYRAFTFKDRVLTCTAAPRIEGSAPHSSSKAVSAVGPHPAGSKGFDAPNTVERVVVAGQSSAPKAVTLVTRASSGDKTETPLSFTYDAGAKTVTVKKPDARVVDDWELRLE
jgi:alpha 1,3-glucosidase